MIRRSCMLVLALLATASASAGWDPLQKAERAASEGARLLAAGDSTAAIDRFLRAQALDPDDPRIRHGLAEAFYGTGEFGSALGQFRSIVGEEQLPASDPMKTNALYNAGNTAFAMGDYETALAHYTDAVVAGSTDPDLLHNLELAQQILEQAQQQQQQQDENSQNDEEGEQQEQDDQEQQEGEQQQQEQQQEDGEQQEQEQEQEQESEDGESEGEEEQQEQEQPSAAPDSLPPPPSAAADSLAVRAGMTPEEAMRLLEALDHDEEELRKSILRRLRSDDEDGDNDW